jgi:hypothetical protein
MRREEIKPVDFARYGQELNQTVEAICTGTHFGTSPKSCEFLRYIVRHALSGNPEELKERLIGMALLGRTANYDTGSDASVRVRANDVRKRLNAWRAAHQGDDEFAIELPAGSYIPRFFRPLVLPGEQAVVEAGDAFLAQGSLPPLSLHAIAFPTLVALFLCTICIRWQLTQEHPFTTFWQAALQDHHAILYLPPSSGSVELISRDSLDGVAPLLNLAGQFHSQLILTRTPRVALSSNDILVTVGPDTAADRASGVVPSSQSLASLHDPIAIEDTQQGRQIVDFEDSSAPKTIAGPAALLTISNGPEREMHIDGTDDRAIAALIRQLCERDTFPQDLTDSFQAGTVTQVVFPMSPKAEIRVLHEPLPKTPPAPLSQ